jgi:hypothetical protein
VRWLIRKHGVTCLRFGRRVLVLSTRPEVAYAPSVSLCFRGPRGGRLTAVNLWRDGADV